MKCKLKRIICAILAAFIALAAAGCGKNNEEKIKNSGKELTYWVEFGNQEDSGADNFADLPLYKELLKEVGVNVRFIHPKNGQVEAQLNLLLSSQNLPDIIQYAFGDYPGGGRKAIDDGCIIPLDMNKAPNLKTYLEKNPNIAKQVKTCDDEYYTFPCIYGDEMLLVFSGIIVRQDYLDKLGEPRPETIDEWYRVLTRAKNELGLSAPFIVSYENSSFIANAFGTYNKIYAEQGKVKYGPLEPGFRYYVETMRKWYTEGLLYKNLANLDGKTINKYILGGDAIATTGNTGGGIGVWSAALKGTEADLRPAKTPVLNKGDKPFGGHRVNEYSTYGSASITPACTNLNDAYKLLDFGYGEKGHMMFNFGIENLTYEMIDGYPKYTEFLTDNPNGKSMSTMLGMYALPNGVAPSVRDKRYMEQYAALPAQQESLKVWADTGEKEHLIPPVTFTPEETDEILAIKSELEKYTKQMVIKYIVGAESLESYDNFVNTINQLGAERYIEIYQQAYDRYVSK